MIKTNLTPYGWGIVDKDGNAVRQPFDQDKAAVKAYADFLNRNKLGRIYRVVQLFYKDES